MTEARRPRLAVVSPFLDKHHGTERRVVEWVSWLARDFEIHIYSQRVEDVDLSQVVWHRIPALPGPHLFGFLWWFAANHVWRIVDARFRGLHYDLVFSPGANCLDADVVSVHILFFEYVRQNRERLRLAGNAPRMWLRILHRKLYYALAVSLERRVYRNPRTTLIVISRATGRQLAKLAGREDFPVFYAGVEAGTFNPQKRAALRPAARGSLELPQDQFALLLVGNDWRNKGVPVLLAALDQLRDLPICLLVVSREEPSSCLALVKKLQLDGRVRLLPPRDDVEFYYAAADCYAGPSMQDSFARPPAEAMACGLPVIVSAAAGVSETITDGEDGLILDDPTDAKTLAGMIRRLYVDETLRARLGEKAAETTQRYTWEKNGRDLAVLLEELLRRKAPPAAQALEAKAMEADGVSRKS